MSMSTAAAETGNVVDTGLDRERRAAYLQRLRAGADRAALGLPVRARTRGLTQREVVEALGHLVGERQWRNLERCERAWPRHVADAYAQLLGLEGRSLRVFYGVVGHRPAAQGISGELTDPERFMLSRAFARCTPWYICDELWDIRATNAVMTEMVPQLIPGVNVMEFVLAHPAAQRICVDWYEKWAAPMVHQLRSTLSHSTRERREGLLAVARSCCAANPPIEALWAREVDLRLSPNGDRRGLRPADPDSPDGLGEPIELMLYGMAPLNRPMWRAIWFFPTGHHCELCRDSGYDDGARWFPARGPHPAATGVPDDPAFTPIPEP